MQDLSCCFFQKITFYIFFLFFCFWFPTLSHGEGTQVLQYEEYQFVEDTQKISAIELSESFQDQFPDTNLVLEWDIIGQPSQKWTEAIFRFDDIGVQTFILNIYAEQIWASSRSLVESINGEIFVYQQAIATFISPKIEQKKVRDFQQAGKLSGVLFFESEEIWEGLKKIKNTDFSIVWWDKEYIFWTLWDFWRGAVSGLNLVLISSHNPHILQWFITNSISWNMFLQEAIIIDESLRVQILQEPESIMWLKNQLSTNEYRFMQVISDTSIQPWFFLSRFVNELSLSGVSPREMYIILMIPFLLTFTVILKHFVGFSTFGSVIPVFLSLLFVQFGLIFTSILCLFLICINMSIWYFFKKYTLLYMPKIVTITLINFIAFILLFNLSFYTALPSPEIHSIFYVLIFCLTAEKMIHIMNTKEFREYKESFWGTFIVAILWYMIYSLGFLQSFLLAYPEYLLLLIPLNIYLWRFTGLRITEYFRFRDVHRSIEE